MHNESGSAFWVKRISALILVALLAAGLSACGPTSQNTKPDESSGRQGGYGGYGY